MSDIKASSSQQSAFKTEYDEKTDVVYVHGGMPETREDVSDIIKLFPEHQESKVVVILDPGRYEEMLELADYLGKQGIVVIEPNRVDTICLYGLNNEAAAKALASICESNAHYSCLYFFNCSFNKEIAAVLAQIASISDIEILKKGNKNINTEVIAVLAQNKSITRLFIENQNQVNDDTLAALDGLKLSNLFVSNCRITDTGIRRLVTKHKDTISLLDVSRNDGVTNAAMADLANLPYLVDLRVSPNITVDGIRSLALGSAPIECLDLRENDGIDDRAFSAIEWIVKNKKIKSLNLTDTEISHTAEYLLYLLRNETKGSANPLLTSLETNCRNETCEVIDLTRHYPFDRSSAEVQKVAAQSDVREGAEQQVQSPGIELTEEKKKESTEHKSSQSSTVFPSGPIKRSYEEFLSRSPTKQPESGEKRTDPMIKRRFGT